MKKVFGKRILLGLSCLLIITSLLLISAQPFGLGQQTSPSVDSGRGITNAEVFFSDVSEKISSLINNVGLDPTNATSILLGLLLWMILYSVLKKTNLFGKEGSFGNEGKFWTGIVAAIVTIISMIYIPKSMFLAIAGQYAALGATVLTVMPFAFAVYFTVAVTESQLVARGIWLVFFLYYIVIGFYVWATAPQELFGIVIDENKRAVIEDEFKYYASHFAYFIVAIASFIMFWAVGFFRHAFWGADIESKIERANRVGKEAVEGVKLFKNIFERTAKS